jgi:ABC-type sugar transport system substrate-binding protein
MGVNLDSQDAQSDQSKQLQQIETAINAGADGVIVNTVDADTGEACIEAAGGKPIIFVNRPPSDPWMVKDYPNAGVCASNEDHSGGYQGEWLAKYFKEQGKTDIKYILLSGQLGNYSTTHRTDSAIQGMKDGGLNPTEALPPIVADWDRATAMDMVAPALTSTEYDCIICNNDAMALGVVEAMETAGLDPSSIPIVGVDATVDGCAAVKEGKMYMTVFQNPVGQGSGAMHAVINMIEGKPLNEGTDFDLDPDCDQIVWVPFEPVDASNVDDYM